MADLERVRAAVQGDRDALTELLLGSFGQVRLFVSRRIPDVLAGVLSPEDIVQDTHIEVFRTIGRFEAVDTDSFDRWIMTIARQRLADRIKEYKRKKRGGDRQRVRKRNDGFQSSIGTLLDIVAQTSSTPSRAVARRERGRAVLIALASIRTEYREALQLRYLKGLPVAAIAEHLGKTEPAIHMLCNRGLKQLRERLGDRSDYLSKS